MFDGSVKYNVSFGDNGKGEKTEEQIKKAVEVAQR